MLNFQLLRQMYRQILNALLISLFCLHPVWADDTEIYFRPIAAEETQPNILFVLDNSGSMDNFDVGKSLSRDQRMNTAMATIINGVSNVNIGVMRFSHNDNGGAMIYPVSNIEEVLCDGVPCSDTTGFTGTVTTTRQALIDSINEMVMNGHTPSVGALVEASHYFKGEPIEFGKIRMAKTGGQQRPEYSRVSHPDSYTGGHLYQPPGCTNADLSDPSCGAEEITGTPVYKSPIKNECQSNYIVFVSDGQPSVEPDGLSAAEGIVPGGSCLATFEKRGQCGAEMAAHMFNSDMQAGISGSNVITHTVGFELDSPWLESVAMGAGGTYTTAETSNDLVEAFSDIFTIIENSATFVAPGVTIDQFSRLSHREDVYLSLFKPSTFPGWPGNLKGYNLKGANLYGEDDLPAVDTATGQFFVDSQSYWSGGQADGLDITLGGAAARLDHNGRKAVTYTGTAKNLFHVDNELDADNPLVQLFVAGSTPVNVAPLGSAAQSTTSHSGAAGRAIDGNRSGVYRMASVTHTNINNNDLPWWEVTLTDEVLVDRIVLHNRTDCCSERLNNVHVFVSDTPFGGATLAELLADPDIWHEYLAGEQPREKVVSVGQPGRYVRVQLAQSGALSLAEVEVFGSETADPVARENLLDWIRGMDVKDANGDQDTTDNRHHMGDPLHSTSVTVTYGGDADDPDSVVFVGTNEGYLHAISTRTGNEEFAFMPESLLKNIETLFENQSYSDKVYGMDGDLSLWINDDNGNGIIDAGVNSSDHAYLYAGMRRGGNHYYALNVTDRSNPKFMFSIPEVDPVAFGELGQTWSKPVRSKILVSANNVRDVLIFGGGYDESQDDKTTRLPDTKGRALYIVDALNGSVIWSGQPTAAAGGSTKAFTDMQYSIPSDVTVIEKEGLASQIYVGDMGGQLWRFDIPNTDKTGADLVDGGVIARLSGTTPATARRFYHAPDLVLSKFNGKTVLNIGIGSGYRAHPLDTVISDNFYQIRYPFKATGNYGLHLDQVNQTTFDPIDMDDLYDTTNNLIGESGDAGVIAAERAALEDSAGWFINMERGGEKILGSSTTLENVVRFISYVPGTHGAGVCEPDIGESFFWTVNLEDGTPYDTRDKSDRESDGPLEKEDRWQDIPGGGLAPPVKTIFVATGDGVTPTNVSGVNVLDQVDNIDVTKRWYWAENPE